MNRRIALTLGALALGACSPDFDPASKIEKLRVLAVQAEPPEIEAPGPDAVAPERATLRSLVLRPDFDPDAPRTTTIVHLACVPEPGNPAPTPCVMLANLRDPAVAIAEGARQACAGGSGPDRASWPPIGLVGLEACADATCGPAMVGGAPLPPPELVVTTAVRERFDALPRGAPDRILGVQAVVLAFALDAAPDELVQGVGTACAAGDVAGNLARLWPAREHVLAMKRVLIRGPEAPDARNENPAIDGITAGATLLEAGVATAVRAGRTSLRPELPGDAAARQLYTKLDAAGVPIEAAREEWVVSWFSTHGDIDELHTREAEENEWNVAGPPGARGVVAAVVRDLRGGIGWSVREVRIAP